MIVVVISDEKLLRSLQPSQTFTTRSLGTKMLHIPMAIDSAVVAAKLQSPLTQVYGHVHMAKTAGSEINGELASHFERVCGNKGYSHDFFQYNERFRNSAIQNVAGPPGDIVNKVHHSRSRAHIPINIMWEEGFEDCDWISLEMGAGNWKNIPSHVGPIEYHIPCRDPISHLMSQCNYKRRRFDCNAKDLGDEIKSCLGTLRRFRRAAFQNQTLKCFNPIPINGYLDYMSLRLQRKRIENDYLHRDTNRPRKKSRECIWNNTELTSKVQQIMVEEYDYYKFCDECMVSSNNLLL